LETEQYFSKESCAAFMAFFASMIMRIMLKYRWLSWAGLLLLVYLTAMMLHDGLVDLGVISSFFA